MKQRRLERNKPKGIQHFIVQPRMFGYLLLGWVFFWITIFILGILLNMDATMGGI